MVTNLDDAVIQVKIDTTAAERELVALDGQAAEVGQKAEDAQGLLKPGKRRVGRRQGTPAEDAARRGSGGVAAGGAVVAAGARLGLKFAARATGIVGAAILAKEVVEIGSAFVANEVRAGSNVGAFVFPASQLAPAPLREPLARAIETMGNSISAIMGILNGITGTFRDTKQGAIGQITIGGGVDTGALKDFALERSGVQAALAFREFEKDLTRKALAGTAIVSTVLDLVGANQETFFARYMGN